MDKAERKKYDVSSSKKHKKSKKKHKKRCTSSDSLESESDKLERMVVEKPAKRDHQKSKKKHKKRYTSSDSSESESTKMEWVEAKRPVKSDVYQQNSLKKHKKRYTTSDSSGSESDTLKRVEAEKLKSDVCQQRDDWMCEEEFVPTFSKKDVVINKSKLQMKKDLEANINKEIQNKRELNPYWKDNGKGLPDKEIDTESLRLPSTSVGDGGYSWLKKAYQRIKEQANREERSMEDVAVERWGSLDKLVSMIDEAESRMKNNNMSSVRVKHRIDDPDKRPSRMLKPEEHYERIKKSPINDSFRLSYVDRVKKFKKPQMDESLNPHSTVIKSTNDESYAEIQSVDRTYKPSWKKPKPEEDLQQKNYFNEKRGENYRPSWKKPKPEEDLQQKNDFNKKQGYAKTSTAVSDCPPIKVENYSNESRTSDAAGVESTPMTEGELSKLSAKYHKAELMGNMELAAKLKAQLDAAHNTSSSSNQTRKKSQNVQENIVLSKIDSSGQSRPLFSQHREDNKQHREDKQKPKRSRKNEFFDEDSKYSLKQMFEREKLTTVDDHLQMFVDVAAESKDPEDLDYECDDVSKKFSKKMSHSYQESKDIGKAIYQHQRLNSALERCEYCLDQPNMKKHLIIKISSQAYLCLPPFQSIVDGHCLIVPKSHVSSCLYLDEDDWLDIKNFKEGLRKVFKSEDKCVIFIETSINFRNCPHAVIECIPMPKETADLAPFYFKKAIQESEGEWCHNKKLIDLTDKGLHYSVPRELPYFCVEFDPDIHRGYAHVVEDEKYFPKNFGKEVIGGMLDIDYNYLYKNRKEDPIKKSKEVLTFEKKWKSSNCE